MDLNKATLKELEGRLDEEVSAVNSPEDLEQLRRGWLAKDGTIKGLFKSLRNVPADDKPAVAAGLNDLKSKVEKFVETRSRDFELAKLNEKLSSEFFDVSLPSKSHGYGRVHPVRRIDREIAAILKPFGFKIVDGPEVESEYYCFDALNIPAHHPARDMQDTFYTETGHILRTHTTSVQARELEKGGLPVKIASFGRVYRNETEDPTHQAMFHQFELVWLDRGLTVSHLLALMKHILQRIYGQDRKVKFVPKFYPYTEPSIGPQIECAFCNGKGCNACVYCGWSTVGGSGMIHRKVLEEFGYNPEEVSGFAFGMGSTKLATQEFNTPNMKILYDSDLRVLKSI